MDTYSLANIALAPTRAVRDRELVFIYTAAMATVLSLYNRYVGNTIRMYCTVEFGSPEIIVILWIDMY